MLESTTDGAFWKNLKWWCCIPKACCPEDEPTAASDRAPCRETGEPVERVPILFGVAARCPRTVKIGTHPKGWSHDPSHQTPPGCFLPGMCILSLNKTPKCKLLLLTPSYMSVHLIPANILYRWATARLCSITSLTCVRWPDHK